MSKKEATEVKATGIGECVVFGEYKPRRKACENCTKERGAEYHEACKAGAAQKAANPAKKSGGKGGGRKGHSSPQYMFILNKLQEGRWTRKEIMAAFLTEFPNAAKSTVGTYLSDGMNDAYNKFPHLVKRHEVSKVLYFEGHECHVTEAPKSPEKKKEDKKEDKTEEKK